MNVSDIITAIRYLGRLVALVPGVPLLAVAAVLVVVVVPVVMPLLPAPAGVHHHLTVLAVHLRS